jgi:hypothetical protein
MVKVIVGLMGSSVAQSGSTLSTPAGMRELLDVSRRFGVEELDVSKLLPPAGCMSPDLW